MNVTIIQLDKKTRDRLHKLKFRKSYDEFLNELCDMYVLYCGRQKREEEKKKF